MSQERRGTTPNNEVNAKAELRRLERCRLRRSTVARPVTMLALCSIKLKVGFSTGGAERVSTPVAPYLLPHPPRQLLVLHLRRVGEVVGERRVGLMATIRLSLAHTWANSESRSLRRSAGRAISLPPAVVADASVALSGAAGT